jgi:oxygen-independent coproporphyrinogen III oxidase
VRGLYVHIPFCAKKCSYCDFYSLPARQDSIESYVQAVLKEAESCSPSFAKEGLGENFSVSAASHQSISEKENPSLPLFDTFYLGGGTPSLLGPEHLTTLITGLSRFFVIPDLIGNPERHYERSAVTSGRGGTPTHSMLVPSPLSGYSTLRSSRRKCREGQDEGVQQKCEGMWQNVEGVQNYESTRHCERSAAISGLGGNRSLSLLESTIELNPESATKEFLQTVINLGFTRVSFGVQSLSDDELRSVGRIHTAKQAIAAVKQAQTLKFQSISADLIIGLPGQTWTSLHISLSTLVGLGLQHLSVYCLSLETGTPLAANPPADLPSDDLQAELYEKTRSFLLASGFAHYEISNFALPGHECLHNLNYWRGGEYLGLGPAAASHLDGKRSKNRPDLDAYLQNPTGQTEYVEELTASAKAAEEAMLRLRLLQEGLNTDELTAKFSPANTPALITRLDKMVQEGLLIHESHMYRLHPSHILTSNSIFSRVLSDNRV